MKFASVACLGLALGSGLTACKSPASRPSSELQSTSANDPAVKAIREAFASSVAPDAAAMRHGKIQERVWSCAYHSAFLNDFTVETWKVRFGLDEAGRPTILILDDEAVVQSQTSFEVRPSDWRSVDAPAAYVRGTADGPIVMEVVHGAESVPNKRNYDRALADPSGYATWYVRCE